MIVADGLPFRRLYHHGHHLSRRLSTWPFSLSNCTAGAQIFEDLTKTQLRLVTLPTKTDVE
jgi:hypothetical protein